MVLKSEIIETLKNYLDPELGIDIWTLGFIRELDFNETKQTLRLVMTLTSPLCPLGSVMIRELDTKFRNLGVKDVAISLTFDPPWQPPAVVKEMLGMS
ncbi:hypothetical protein A3C96_03865 [Candidatus Uhrbacteria bacterium RIFCSPHIGHO2_02_FULL_60_10]|uniref:MIP18 family-like domain-containing protein n=1 Tax=Candidatus Uhrbacteria bacterium RIFCSPHIGHO2_02_FULL_60_10 TaxID=1802392 RepID=A0A1F7U6A8_9BACT|nr:MAG: hypothetical protein A3C96_03865 [Candidatus Uhrbacteria bacterium RIFCSPHIGHO2_02_FULL_60_10]